MAFCFVINFVFPKGIGFIKVLSKKAFAPSYGAYLKLDVTLALTILPKPIFYLGKF